MTTEMTEVDSPTHEDICTFCDEVNGSVTRFHELGLVERPGAHVLLRTEHFAVVPCVGALTDWYVLIVPRRHVLSSGWLTAPERAELRALLDEMTRRLTARTGQGVVVFEHGSHSFRDKGGACHDHCHVHMVATGQDVGEFVRSVSGTVRLEPCGDWIEDAAHRVRTTGRSYLAIETREGGLIATATGAPSAFFRKALVRWLGAEPGEDDWLVYPHTERLRAMIETGLQGL